MRKLFLLITILGCLTVKAWAQRNCGTMEHLQMLLQQDPSLAERMQQIESFTQNWIASNSGGERSLITIPVVVHVVYKTTAQNISDAQVQAQIDQLNADFARLNSDAGNTPSAFLPVAANCEVQFCLAQRDPAGNATNGIIHKLTTATSFSSNDNIKKSANGGDDAWDRNSYLNIWTGNLSGGLLGYAQFPGGPAATDGIVVLYSSVGSIASPGTEPSYDLGRSATHEIGHWLNLFHIWGDDGTSCGGSDQVADTPNQSAATFGCPSFPHVSCSNGPNGNMFMNYMDYSDDDCMNIFTAGQKSRMQALFAGNGSRVSIVTSQGCVPPNQGGCTDLFEPNNNKNTAKPIIAGISIQALINSATDRDFFSFANTSVQPNIKVTVTNLPANYDIKLLNSAGVKVASSHNSGTIDESCIFNNAAVGIYKPNVYGFSGAFNTTDCYTLTAFISSAPFKLGHGDEVDPKSMNDLSNIYPNPSKGSITVVYNSAMDADVKLTVFDLMGRMVHNQMTTASEGLNSFHCNYADLQSGIYMLEVINGSEVKRMKFEIAK